MNNEIKKVTEILLEGGVAVFPTDTVYGIGTLPREKSVRKILKYDIDSSCSGKMLGGRTDCDI